MYWFTGNVDNKKTFIGSEIVLT